MTQEEKQLLLKDLCARLPYGVKVSYVGDYGRVDCVLNSRILNSTYAIEYLGLKPYLRPMSSMTEEEKKEYDHRLECMFYDTMYDDAFAVDWLNEHHFDFRGLIEKGLALEAPEDMYKTE